jgi:hypothetical protein
MSTGDAPFTLDDLVRLVTVARSAGVPGSSEVVAYTQNDPEDGQLLGGAAFDVQAVPDAR